MFGSLWEKGGSKIAWIEILLEKLYKTGLTSHWALNVNDRKMMKYNASLKSLNMANHDDDWFKILYIYIYICCTSLTAPYYICYFPFTGHLSSYFVLYMLCWIFWLHLHCPLFSLTNAMYFCRTLKLMNSHMNIFHFIPNQPTRRIPLLLKNILTQ